MMFDVTIGLVYGLQYGCRLRLCMMFDVSIGLVYGLQYGCRPRL